MQLSFAEPSLRPSKGMLRDSDSFAPASLNKRTLKGYKHSGDCFPPSEPSLTAALAPMYLAENCWVYMIASSFAASIMELL